MKAIVCDRFGPPDVLELREIDRLEVADDEVLIRVHASSLNPFDWFAMTGRPYIARLMFFRWVGLRRPKRNVVGADFAGRVEAAGSSVTQLRPGDEYSAQRRAHVPST